jgi:hypothetical protein
MRAVAKIDIAGLKTGDVCGLGSFGKYSAQLAVIGGSNGARTLRMQLTESMTDGPRTEVRVPAIAISGRTFWLRTDMDFDTKLGRVGYSLDNRQWTNVGAPFPLAYDWRTGTFQGQQIALSCYNSASKGGYLDIDSFTLSPLSPGVRP